MTIWCNSCKCHVSAPCTSHHLPEEHRSSVCRRFRSTKGASKARRDHINHEIRNMRALLPITQEDQERLSYLHSMAAICTYIRKSVLFQGLPAGERSHCSLPYEEFLDALPGFLLVSTAQGRLVYVSENVSEYTGLSMVDVLQGDTLYDMVERSDVDVIMSNLDTGNNLLSERSFICSLQSSKSFKLQHGSCCSVLVRGSFQFFPQPSPAASQNSEPLFVAFCTPTVNRLTSTESPFCLSFNSTHRLDMSFTQLSDSVLYLLGYSVDEMTSRSWYSLVHPEDLSSAADSHRSLMQADEGFQVEMVLRFQRTDLSWTWIYIRANKDSECQSISCTNFIISETEAKFLQKKISINAFKPFMPNSHHLAQQAPESQSYSPKCSKRQRTSNSRGEEPGARARRESGQDIYCVLCTSSQGSNSPVPLGESLALFTPPYSPASSNSSLPQEELSHDFLMDAHECTNQLLSSPEGSPSYYTYSEARLTCHQSPTDPLPAAAENFDRRDFGMFSAHSPLSSSSSTYDFQPCTSDARLVPDCLSVSDTCESPVDCASLHPDDFALMEQPQEGSLVQPHHVPHQEFPLHSSLLTPHRSSISTEANLYNAREQAEISILAQQISSLASSFDMHHTLNPLQNVPQHTGTNTSPSAHDWHHSPPPPSALLPKRALVHDDSVFDSILKDLNVVTRKSSASRAGVIAYSFQQGSRSGSHQSDQEPLGLIAEDSLPAEQFTTGSIAMDPFSLQLGHQDHNIGLHQLNHFM
ncbi:neuronal PAS domain-containing protein 4-like isoform 1-T2 [Odontesthes bonariensis]|uniref:neuronal PAS domain-containing protein 4-like n=1 Tax=Odontesthes bonariensis TaxID=219752 RepID=UPI003F58B2C1